jgi:hypothetical protein
MPERHSRVALAIVALAALVVAGVLGRLTAPTAGTPLSRDSRPVGSSPSAPDTRTVAGVPVGYSRTRGGAVAAMAAYGHALADPRVQLDDRRRAAVVATVGTDRYAHTVSEGSRAFAALRAGPVGQALRPGARAVFIAIPVAYRVMSFSPSKAVIRSWSVAIAASDTGIEPHAGWDTTTTTALWKHGDWKVDRVTSQPGPVPASTDGASTAVSFIDRLRGMRALRYAP